MASITVDIGVYDIACDSCLMKELLDEYEKEELIDHLNTHYDVTVIDHAPGNDQLKIANHIIELCKEVTSNIYTKKDVLDTVAELLEMTTLK